MCGPPVPSGRRSDMADGGMAGPLASPPTIRPLRQDDLREVTAIERVSFATPWSEQTFLNLLKRSNACLLSAVSSDRRVLGYAAVWFAGGEGELGDLAVDPAARRTGVGSRPDPPCGPRDSTIDRTIPFHSN